MTDIATIGIAVDSRDVPKASRELQKLQRTGSGVEKTTGSMTAGFKRMAVQLAAVVSVTAGFRKLIDISRQFDVINASLVTVTGSTEAANVAFQGIQAFASTTPFSLEQVAESFIKLNTLGLEPSREALISYGNTASAMGKNLNQLIEAVADAATGEFERLKEFGIKARVQGDNVSFTFKGVATTVRNNAAEIQKYLRNIGDTDFAGAMERRANSLDGALSNLGDSWDQLFLTISQQGTGDLIFESVKAATAAIEELDAFIASGGIEAHVNAIGIQFENTANDIKNLVEALTDIIGAESDLWGEDGKEAAQFISEAFANLPANLRAIVQLATIELAVLLDRATELAKEIEFAMTSPIENIKRFVETGKTGLDVFLEKQKEIDARRLNSIDLILLERDATIAKSDAERRAANEALAAEKARRAARTGELPGISTPGGGEEQKTAAQKKLEEQIKKTRESLETWIARSEYELTLSKLSDEQREKSLKIWDLQKKGIDLNSEAYAELSARLDDVYDQKEAQRKFLEEQEELAKRQEQIWNDTVGQLQSHFSDGFFDIMQGNFDSLGDGFEAMLDRMIADALAAQLTQSLFGSQDNPSGLFGSVAGLFGGGASSGGGASGGGLGDLISSFLPAFATGGDFTVGGKGGIDNNVVAFKASKGERVSVQTPAQQQANGGMPPIINNFTISAPVDRRSQQQIADAAFQGARRATQRNA